MISLNHVGIAVSDLPHLKKLFSILGLNISHSEKVDEQGVKVHFLPLPKEQSQIELLEVQNTEGTVAKFIQKRGPGIHHLSFLLESGQLLPISEKLKKEGFQLIYAQPKKGAHEMKINFIHPSSSGGILIELMEKNQ